MESRFFTPTEVLNSSRNISKRGYLPLLIFAIKQGHQTASFGKYLSGGGNSAGIFVSKVSPGTFVMKITRMPIIFGKIKLPFSVR